MKSPADVVGSFTRPDYHGTKWSMDDSKLSFRGARQHDLAGIQISEIPEEESGEHHPSPTVTTMASMISGPCETVFLASLVTRPQGDGGGAIFAPQGDVVG
jgi:hypothetical protein